MTPRRDHRLRERRLKLGVSQATIADLAGIGQSAVSQVERGKTTAHERRVREVIIYIESKPRRERAWQRDEDRAVAKIEATLAAGGAVGYDEIVVTRLVGLLCEGREAEYDLLAARVGPELERAAADQYLDFCQPTQPKEKP